ncbi:hypothetical protein JCM8547_003987 [Rhodosporidiobolus lusitaniae]
MSSDPQLAAQAKFAQLGFFILSGLPKGSEFGLDTKLWQTAAFSGVKFIPPGLHLFVFSAAPSAAQQGHLPESLSSGVGVRHGLLRFFRTGETVVEEWDNGREELKRPSSCGAASRKRRRTVEDGREETAVSEEYLKGLDKSLAAYPQEDIAKQWKSLTGFITEETVARVVGVDERGSALVDALMGSPQDEQGAGPDEGIERRTWGKEREPDEDEEEVERIKEIVEEDEEEGEETALVEFVKFDEKRSWPKGATGEELSRWSKDKSWQLSQVVQSQLGDNPQELLGELQLAFILFSLVHNFSSLIVYKSLFSLICRSSALAHPPSSRPDCCSLPSPLLSTSALPLFASFLALVYSQVDFLEPSFFSTQLPSLEAHLLDSLAILSQSLSDALPAWTHLAQEDPNVASVWKEVIKRWDALAALTQERFGWDLGVIKGSRAGYTTAAPGQGRVWHDADEQDLDELEEGEDAPVIVDEEGLYINSDDY